MAERLTVGVAARLSRYLQVLTQAKKMGKDRISSQEIAEYTNINATQIRRDLSAFGKFGRRGVGYRTDGLLDEIRSLPIFLACVSTWRYLLRRAATPTVRRSATLILSSPLVTKCHDSASGGATPARGTVSGRAGRGARARPRST